MPSNTMWYGESHEYTPSELNFMVSAVANCQKCQELGMCESGARCAQCNYGAAMQATESLDALTKSRVYDKADTVRVIRETVAQNIEQQKKTERIRLFGALLAAAIFIAAICLIPVFEIISCNDTLPVKPYVSRTYDCKKNISTVMKHIRTQGVIDCVKDNKIDCKDYAITFMILWYNIYEFDERTCVLVHNTNYKTGMDHLFVAVYTGEDWLCIEPQAYDVDNWSLDYYWGDKYDPVYNNWKHTSMFVQATRYSWDFKERLLKKAGIDIVKGG